jgi:hypothetical protein
MWLHAEIYAHDEKALVVIHLSDRSDRGVARLQRQWEQLPPDTQKRVLWLVVSGGSGYPAQKTWSDHAHFLRYPLDATTLQRGEIRACFQQFLAAIEESDSAFVTPDWKLLYPPENVMIVTLLTVLCAAKVCNVRQQLQILLGSYETRTAVYRQYLARTILSELPTEFELEALRHLAEHEAPVQVMDTVRTALQRVLGAVPD